MPNIEFSMIETPRLWLNKLTKYDREPLLAIFSYPKIIEHYDVARFKSIEIADRLIAYFDTQFDSNTGIRWAIRSRTLGEFLGTCGFIHWYEFVCSAVVGSLCIKTIGAKAIQLNRWGPLSILFLVRVCISMWTVLSYSFYLVLSLQKISQKCRGSFRGNFARKCYRNNDFHDMNMFGILRNE